MDSRGADASPSWSATCACLLLPVLCAAEAAGAEGTGPVKARAADYFSLSAAALAAEATSAPAAEAEEAPEAGPRGWPLLPAYGQEGLIDFLDFDLLEKAGRRTGGRARLYPARGVSGQDTDLGMTRYDLGYRAAETDVLPMWNARFRLLDLDTNARLPDTGERLPGQLWDVQAGLTFLWMLPPGLFNVTFGSASDKLFNSADEMTADITYLIGTLQPEEEGFLFIVNYNNNRDYLNRVILPGFVYRKRLGSGPKFALGFPFSGIRWDPCKALSVSATYSFPRTVRARLTYEPVKRLKLFAGFDWDSQRYFRHDRLRTRDRLWYVEKRLAAGLRWEISERAFLEVVGGYAFDRFFFEGRTYEDRGFNRLDIGDGVFGGVRFGIRF